MARRFADVLKGAEHKKALDNYIKYKSDTANKQSKRMQGGSRGAARTRGKSEVYIRPFSANLSADFKGYAVNVADPTKPAEAKFNENLVQDNRILLTVTEADSVNWDEPPDGFQPAKVTIFNPDGTSNYVQSKITKLYYLKYGGKSYTCVFGAKTETEEYRTARALVRKKFLDDFNKVNFRVNCTPEKS